MRDSAKRFRSYTSGLASRPSGELEEKKSHCLRRTLNWLRWLGG